MALARVQVPASTTNLGPGFDALGVALRIYNRVELDSLPWGVAVEVEGEGRGVIPRDESNVCVQAVKRVYERANRPFTGLWMKQRNHIPLARGLGSSSAAIVGGIVGANVLLGAPLGMDELVQLAVEMEGHPDNVVPALMGGFCVSATASDGRTIYTRMPVVERYRWVIAIPDFEVSTREAREKLPERGFPGRRDLQRAAGGRAHGGVRRRARRALPRRHAGQAAPALPRGADGPRWRRYSGRPTTPARWGRA